MKAAAIATLISTAMLIPTSASAADPLPRAKPEAAGMSSERLALIAKIVKIGRASCRERV